MSEKSKKIIACRRPISQNGHEVVFINSSGKYCLGKKTAKGIISQAGKHLIAAVVGAVKR